MTEDTKIIAGLATVNESLRNMGREIGGLRTAQGETTAALGKLSTTTALLGQRLEASEKKIESQSEALKAKVEKSAFNTASEGFVRKSDATWNTPAKISAGIAAIVGPIIALVYNLMGWGGTGK